MTGSDLVDARKAPPWLVSLARLGRTRDYTLTFVTEFATLGCSLAALKLAAVAWGAAGFGEYVLARRTLSLLQLPILCGMSVAVTRYVARARSGAVPGAERRYFTAGLLASVTSVGFALLALNAVPGPVAALLLGSSSYSSMVRALSLAIAGLGLHGVAYGFLRGRLSMIRANALQALNLGIIPVGALAAARWGVVAVVTVTGLAWCVVSGVAAGLILRRTPCAKGARGGIRGAVRELVGYGLPRVPGEFALGALFTLPVTVAVHYRGVTMAGFIGLAVALVTMMGSLFAPLGQILLPAVTARAARGDRHGIEGDAWRVTGLCLVIAAAGAVAVEGLAGWLIPRFFGREFWGSVPVIRIVTLGALPYVGYVVLRNVLDALHTAPLNAKNLIVALGLFLITALLAGSAEAVPVALTVALFGLGGLSAWDAHRLLGSVRLE